MADIMEIRNLDDKKIVYFKVAPFAGNSMAPVTTLEPGGRIAFSMEGQGVVVEIEGHVTILRNP